MGGGHVSDKGWEECLSDFLLVGRAQLKFYFLKKKLEGNWRPRERNSFFSSFFLFNRPMV